MNHGVGPLSFSKGESGPTPWFVEQFFDLKKTQLKKTLYESRCWPTFVFRKWKKTIYFYFFTAFLKKYSKIVYLVAIVFLKQKWANTVISLAILWNTFFLNSQNCSMNHGVGPLLLKKTVKTRFFTHFCHEYRDSAKSAHPFFVNAKSAHTCFACFWAKSGKSVGTRLRIHKGF